jgi:hypothetical protein
MADHCTRHIYHGTPISASSSSSCSEGATVTGLLFGTVTTTTTATATVHITDAEDIPIGIVSSTSPAASTTNTTTTPTTTAVALHQAVYPNHIVVGWYRVAVPMKTSSLHEPQPEPTLQDLRCSQQLVQHYRTPMTSSSSSTNATAPFLFALLPVPSSSSSASSNDGTMNPSSHNVTTSHTMVSLSERVKHKASRNKEKTTTANSTQQQQQQQQQVPLQLYMVDSTASVLIGLDYSIMTARTGSGQTATTTPQPPNSNPSSKMSTSSNTVGTTTTATTTTTTSTNENQSNHTWKLVTAPYERIAVERIMQYQPPNTKTSNRIKSEDTTTTATSAVVSPFLVVTPQLQQSLFAIYERLYTVQHTLQHLHLHPDLQKDAPSAASINSLLRHVQGLVLQIQVMASIHKPQPVTHSSSVLDHRNGPSTTSNPSMATTQLVLQQLVVLTQTVASIQQYTDTYRVIQQHRDEMVQQNKNNTGVGSTATSHFGYGSSMGPSSTRRNPTSSFTS